MSPGSVITLIMIGASAVQCLVVASFALARSSVRLKWLAANCLAGAGYSFGCFLSASDWLPTYIRWCSGPVGYSMAALYFSTIIHFLNLTLDRKPDRWEHWSHLALYIMAVLVWIPGVVFRMGEIRTWEYVWTSHAFPQPTHLIWPAGVVMFCGVGTFVFVILKCSLSFRLSGLFFALCAASDVLNCVGIVHLTWFAALGTLVFLGVLSQREGRKWADEANLLTELKRNLEDRVAQRSAELATSRDELAKHERLASLGRVAASIGHEINNPLTYVICNLEVLRMKYGDSDPGVEDAFEGAKRIARIVEELRVLTRPVAPGDRQVVDMAFVVETAAKTVQHMVASNMRLEVEAMPGCFVRGDSDRLTQVIVNLLSNAIASLPEDDGIVRRVEATTRLASNTVVVVIRDEGRGIPAAVQERLFEPFFTTKSDGLGLGLAISNVIVNEVGGEMKFSSEAGKGSVFELRFPECDATDELPIEMESYCEEVAGRILVVDDEPAVLSSFRRILRNCDVTTEVDGREALRLLEEQDFDIVFCDIVMPGISGLELLERVRENGSTNAKKFVLMSGGNPDGEMDSCLLEQTPFLRKPFSMSDVHRLILEFGEQVTSE